MLLRECRVDDLLRIVEIERAAMKAYYDAGFTYEEVLPRTAEDLRFLLQKTNLVVAVDEKDVPHGYASYFQAGSFLHLEDHVVDPVSQRQGIGTLLLQNFLEVGQGLLDCKYFSLLVFNEANWAQHMYSRAGFRALTSLELEILADDALKRMVDLEQSQYQRWRTPMVKIK